jgi:hypothetical protein
MEQESQPLKKVIHCIQYKKLAHVNPLLYHTPNIELTQSRNNSFVFK